MPNLPQELVDRIIDQVASEIVEKHREELYSDWKDYEEGEGRELVSVARCGLVCKTWLPRSRTHLFSTTRLSNDYESGADNINAFLRLLVRGEPISPLSFVQSLDLDLLGGPLNGEDTGRVLNLPMLTSLRIRTPDDNAPSIDEFFSGLTPHIPLLATNSPWLSCFHLDLNTDLPLPFLIHLLSNLPSLESLTIGKPPGENYDIVNPDSTVPQHGSFPKRLLTLELHLSCGAGLFFAWLLTFAELPIPRSLALSLHLKDRDFPLEASLLPIDEYFRRAGSQLDSLSLAFSRNYLDESDYSTVEHLNLERRLLKSASRLSALTFAASADAWAVSRILGFLPSSKLTALTIVFEEEEAELPWGPMDEALSHPKFETLQRFAVEDFWANFKRNVSLLDEEARAAMPLARARGILHSRFSSD